MGPRTVWSEYSLLLERDRFVIFRRALVCTEAEEFHIPGRMSVKKISTCNLNDYSLFSAFPSLHFLTLSLHILPCFLLCPLFSCCYPRYNVVEGVVNYSDALDFRGTINKFRKFLYGGARGTTDYTGR